MKFKKGQIPWNKGKKGVMSDVWTGRKHKPESKEKMRKAKFKREDWEAYLREIPLFTL